MRYESLFNSDIQAVISQGMNQTLHWFPANVSPVQLAATLVGMANSQGGTVLLGISSSSGKVHGIQNLVETQDRIFQATLMCEPTLVLPLPQFQKSQRGFLLSVNVPAGLPHVYSLDGRYLWREGSQTNPIPARKLRKLLIERGVIQFESQNPPHAKLDDLDFDKIDDYIKTLHLGESISREEILLRRGCLSFADKKTDRNTQISDVLDLRPTYAALLLFGKHPQQWLPNATILAARFSGRTLSDEFIKQDINGTLPDQIRQVEAFVRENVSKIVQLVGFEHREHSEYPPEALRELLVNAVAHRDYNFQGDNIHLNIFSDRIEVHSPGGLPGPVNLENLLDARFSRNVVIVQVLSDMGFVERLGYGLNRVVEVVRENNLRPPKFMETANSFRVILFSSGEALQAVPKIPDLEAFRQEGLNPRQELALVFLSTHRRITNRDYQEMCPDVHSETLRRDLVDLVKRDVLIKVGDKRATYYILKR